MNPSTVTSLKTIRGFIGSPSSLLPRRPRVREDDDAVGPDLLRLRELQGGEVTSVAEQTLPFSEDDREHHQAVLVDEILLLQRVHKLRAAVDDDVVGELLLELAYLGCDIPADDGRVVPLGLVQRRRDDELGHVVELVGELSFPRWPRIREAVVRHAPEEECVGRHRLVELELVSLFAPVELKAPTAVLVILGATRVFDDAVHRHELCDHDLSHGYLRVSGDESRNSSTIE